MRRSRLSTAAISAAVLLSSLWAAPGSALPTYPVINEILYDGPGTDGDDVFIEIVGPPGLSLEGWSLVGINGEDGAVYKRVDLGAALIPADGVLVVATADALPELAAVRDVIAAVDWQNGPDAVQLRDASDQAVDAVQYGESAFPAGEGAPAPLTLPGESLTRDASSTDTQDNATDFSVCAQPTPGVAGADPVDPPDPDPPAQDLLLTVPHATAAPGDTVDMLVAFAVGDASHVVAMDIDLLFDASVLRVVGAALGPDVSASDWSLAHHVCAGEGELADTLALSLATATDALAGTGSLLTLTLVAADTADYVWSPLDISLLAVNADTAAGTAEGGQFSLRGVDASLAAAITPADTLWVSILDADEDRQPAVQDSVPFVLAVGACLDTLIAAESGPQTGSFFAAVPVVRGEPVCGNGIAEVSPDSILVLQYRDRLTASGPAAVLHDTLTVQWSANAHLQATRLVQAGDTLHMRYHDASANRHADMRDTVWVQAANRITQEVELAAMVEVGDDDSLFVGSLQIAAGSPLPEDGVLGISPGDTVRVALVDSAACLAGGGICAAEVLGMRPFGDVDGNGLVQAYDASRVLNHVLEPYLASMDSLAANVDSLAPDGPITPVDAALILQHRVRLLQRFPVQTASSRNQPWWEPAAKAGTARPRLALHAGAGLLTLVLEDRCGLVAGDLYLEGVHGRVQLAPDLEGFLVASRREPGGTRVVLAGPTPVWGPGEVLLVHLEQEVDGPVRIVGSFNDGRIELSGPSTTTTPVPLYWRVLTNYPNPFNSGTQIRYTLAAEGHVVLTVVDVLGRPVRTLTRGHQTAGYHVVDWDGRDDDGRTAGTGVYLCRLQAGSRRWVQPMLLLR